MSKFRLWLSYSFIGATLAVTGWAAATNFPFTGTPSIKRSPIAPVANHHEPATMAFQVPQRPIPRTPPVQSRVSEAPVPPDPRELVTGAVEVLSAPADRAAALGMLERAMQNYKLHMPGTPPFRFDMPFEAAGNVRHTGSGEVTETWLTGQNWRWTVSMGGYSLVRIGYNGRTVEEKPVTEIPSRAQMLRNAIFWATQPAPSNAQIRQAAAQWNGRPVTCLLFSRVTGAPAQAPGRRWEEEEYCIDNASGAVQINSIAPGTYIVYGYGKNLNFHGRVLPDHITIYVAGAVAADARFNITDAGSVDDSQLTPTPEMLAGGPVLATVASTRFALDATTPSTSGAVQPVMVRAEIDGEGNVLEAELSAASDPALASAALELVKNMKVSPVRFTQRQAYINVRFLPR